MKPKYLEKSFTRTLSFERQQEYAQLHMLKKQKEKQEKIKNNFMAFVKEMWPEFIEGRHHKEIADKFDQIAQGKIKRLIIICHRGTRRVNLVPSYFLRGWWDVNQI